MKTKTTLLLSMVFLCLNMPFISFSTTNNVYQNPVNNCLTPTNIFLDNISQSTVDISWDTVYTAIWYRIKYKKLTQNNWYNATTTSNTRTLHNLNDDQQYEYKMQTYCGAGNYSDWSVVDTFTTLAIPPPPVCDYPLNITVNDITANSAIIYWDSIASAYWYNVSYRKVSQNNWFSVSTSNISKQLYSLSSNQEYEYRVRTYCGSGNYGDWSAIDTFLTLTQAPPQVCDYPVNISVNNITLNSADITWDTIPSAIFYRISYKKINQNNWFNSTTSYTNRTLHNLTSNESYEYKLRSYCGSGNWGDWSAVDTFTTLTAPPPPNCSTPQNIIISDITSNSATISWDTVSTAIWYRIKYKKTTQNNWFNSTTTSTLRNIHNLADDQTYEYKLQTYCGAGNYSDWSFVDTFTTLAVPPPPLCDYPNNIIVSNITSNSALVSWDTVSSSIFYRVSYRKITQSNWYNSTTSATNRTLHNLADDQDYEYKVRTYCGSGNWGDWSPVDTFSTLATPPPAPCDFPTNISVSDITSNTALLSWDTISNIIFYRIKYKKLSQNNWFNSTTSLTYRTLHNLTANEDYEYKIQSYCGSGNWGDFSAVDTFTTLALPPPPVCEIPANIVVSNISDHSAQLNWDTVATAIWYKIRYKKLAQTNWFNATSTSTERILNNLSDAESYEYKLQTYCGAGNYGDWSQVDTFTTLAIPPPPLCEIPSNIYISNITHNSAVVNWDTVSTAVWYYVHYKKVSQNNWSTVSTSNTFRPLIGLDDAEDYIYQVKTYCGAGNYGDWSPIDTFTTLAVPPPPLCEIPLNIDVFDITNNSAMISWDTVSSALWYQIQFKKVTQNNWNSTSTSSTTKTLYNLSNTEEYLYKLRSYCGAGNYGDWSAVDTFMTLSPPVCNYPLNIVVADTTPNSALLVWDPVSIVTWYKINYKKASQSNWYNITTNDTSRLISNLTANEIYEYRIMTKCGPQNYSDWSVVDTFITPTGTKSIYSDEIIGEEFTIIPNPNSGIFILDFESNSETQIRIINAQGTIVHSTNRSANFEFNLDALKPGIYFIQAIDHRNNLQVKKMIISN